MIQVECYRCGFVFPDGGKVVLGVIDGGGQAIALCEKCAKHVKDIGQQRLEV